MTFRVKPSPKESSCKDPCYNLFSSIRISFLFDVSFLHARQVSQDWRVTAIWFARFAECGRSLSLSQKSRRGGPKQISRINQIWIEVRSIFCNANICHSIVFGLYNFEPDGRSIGDLLTCKIVVVKFQLGDMSKYHNDKVEEYIMGEFFKFQPISRTGPLNTCTCTYAKLSIFLVHFIRKDEDGRKRRNKKLGKWEGERERGREGRGRLHCL